MGSSRAFATKHGIEYMRLRRIIVFAVLLAVGVIGVVALLGIGWLVYHDRDVNIKEIGGLIGILLGPLITLSGIVGSLQSESDPGTPT